MTGRGWALFAAVSLLWGLPYLFIETALRGGLAPLAIVAGRALLGALTLLPFGYRRGLVGLLRTHWPRLATLAAVEVAGPYLLIAIGEQTVSSAVAGVLIATEPLFVLLLGLALRATSHRLGWPVWAGLAIGFLGVLTLLGVQGAGTGVPLILGAAVCYGLGALLVARWFPDVSPVTVGAGMLIFAAPVLLAVTLLVNPVSSVPAASTAALLSVLALGLGCTAAGFGTFFALINTTGPARAALITYIAPVVATIAGAILLNDAITPRTIAGIALILLGAAAATRSPSKTTRPQQVSH